MLTPLRRSQPGRAGRLATALAAALILGGSGGPVARAQAMLPRGDWVPSWELLYGGFRQVDDLALVAADSAWGLDRSAFVAGRDTRDQTSFVRWEAGVWRSAQIVNDVSLSRIAIVGSTGFAVGDGGAIFRLIGSSWLRYPSPTGSSLSSLDLAGPADGWAAGTRGTILYWDGGIWRPTAVPDALRLVDIRAVASAGGGRAYAMAASGDTERAIRSLEIAIRVFPDRAGAHWRLATLLARDNAVDKAFRELYRSRELGYLDADDLRTNPDWQSLRGDGRWQSLSQGVQPAIGQ